MEHQKINKEELELFASLPDIEVVFDVGARTDLEMVKLKPNAKFYLFEANPDFFLELQNEVKKLNAGNLVLCPYGLGEKEELLPYYIKTQSCTTKYQGNSEHIHIPTTTLDAYVKSHNIKKIDYLKIDTEGMDYLIIKGGLETLKDKVKYIQFEYWTGVAKFIDILPNFELYLMIEPKLAKILHEFMKFDDDIQLIKMNGDLMNIIDNKLIPLGIGGNIIGVKI